MYDKCTVETLGDAHIDSLFDYTDVIWFTGPVSVETLTEGDRRSLVDFLEGGGRLCLSGSRLGLALGETDFYRDYIHAAFVQNVSPVPALSSPADNPVTGTMAFALATEGPNRQLNAEEIAPLAPAFSILDYDQGPGEEAGGVLFPACGAVAFENERYKLVYCAFGLEGVEPLEERAALLSGILSWFGAARPLMGDVNSDGRIDVLDLVLAIRIHLQQYSPTAQEFRRADVNYDGRIDVLDVVRIIQWMIQP
jgi:hypothetical protein